MNGSDVSGCCGPHTAVRPPLSKWFSSLWDSPYGLIYLGVTSFIRAGFINPAQYRLFLHFFRSRAVNLTSLLQVWVTLALRSFTPVMAEGHMVFVADGIKAPKEGRRMPAVKSLHQESTNNSKPPYIPGSGLKKEKLMMSNSCQFLDNP